jgi:hypothetical protein
MQLMELQLLSMMPAANTEDLQPLQMAGIAKGQAAVCDERVRRRSANIPFVDICRLSCGRREVAHLARAASGVNRITKSAVGVNRVTNRRSRLCAALLCAVGNSG